MKGIFGKERYSAFLCNKFRLLDCWVFIIALFSLFISIGMIGCLDSSKKGLLRPDKLSERERIEIASELFKEGLKFLENDKDGKAITSFKKALEYDQNVSAVHNNLGILYKRKGMIDKAIDEYLKAIDIDQNYYEAHNNLGIAYREKGDFKKAEKEYKDTIDIMPLFKDAYLNLGVLYDLYLNQPEKALKNYRKYLKLGGNKKEVELWISDLENLLEGYDEFE
ncbi:MAG: tetratricopeptide repeat protein [Nitrospirota bacterium]